MENSINSSNSEPSVSNLKSIFKKPTDLYQAFEVSLEESVTAAENNKSEPDLDTSTRTQKTLPFKKSRKSVQQPFSVSLSDSIVNSETEQSVTFVKPKTIFKKKNKSLVDFFNVSFDETNASLQSDVFSKSIDESNIAFSKTNPFDKYISESKNTVGNISSIHVSRDEKDESSLESHKHSPYDTHGDEADSITFTTKQNPFKKANEEKSDFETQLQLSVTDENKSTNKTSEPEDKSNTINNFRSNHEADSSNKKNKSNQSQQKKSLQDCNSIISITERRSSRSLEDAVLSNSKQLSKNISIDKSISRMTNNTNSYLEQSSVNDENLNNWMSDHSDEEMPLPRIPSVTTNLSQTKEKPVVPGSPVVSENPLSIWEEKFIAIVSNAKKKSQTTASKMISDPLPKSKPSKKSGLGEKKPSQDLNKYKPPKLMKPAPYATKKLYEYIIKRLEPKYGIDRMIESENLVLLICDTVKKVVRRRTHQKRLIQNLKKEMAEAGLIETTMDFYEFVIKFLPYNFRVKVVPCLQPVTNMVYPPKDVVNPFEKIL